MAPLHDRASPGELGLSVQVFHLDRGSRRTFVSGPIVILEFKLERVHLPQFEVDRLVVKLLNLLHILSLQPSEALVEPILLQDWFIPRVLRTLRGLDPAEGSALRGSQPRYLFCNWKH